MKNTKNEKLKRRAQNIVKRITMALMLLSLSALLLIGGCSRDTVQIDSHSEVPLAASIQGNTSVVHTTIAVVNADMGVEENGVRQNYSAAIIETLDADFVLVSPTMAESGFESGAYGAIITFPSDVSERIISFNTQQPERIQLEFQVNKNLPESDYIDTHLKIMNLQTSINTTLAHTYVSSIYLQFHAAQDQMDFVFSNNSYNLRSLDTIRLPAFSSTLDLDELPDIPFDRIGTDTAQHATSVADFAENVSTVYLVSYAEASQQYLEMREGLFGLIDGLPAQEDDWMSKLEVWAMTKIGYGEEVVDFAADLTAYATDLQVWLDTIYLWYDDASLWHGEQTRSFADAVKYVSDMEIYIDYVESRIEPTLIELQAIYDSLAPSLKDLNDWHDSMDPFFTQLLDWYDEIETAIVMLETWRTGLNAAMINLGTWRDQLNYYVTNVLCANCDTDCVGCVATQPPALIEGFSIPQLNSNFRLPNLPNDFNVPELNSGFNLPDPNSFALPTLVELLGRNPGGSMPQFPDEITLRAPPANGVPGFTEETPTSPTALQPPRPEDFWDSVGYLQAQLSGFDVAAFLSNDVQQQVAEFMSSYESFLSFLSEDMDMQFELNLAELDGVRFGYIDYLAGLKADTLQGEADEQARLRDDLDGVISINESNYEDTYRRLSDFAEMMPESRTQAGMNSDLVDFTISPFEFVIPDVRMPLGNIELEQSTSTDTNVRDIVLISVAGIIVLVALVAFAAYQHRRRRANR